MNLSNFCINVSGAIFFIITGCIGIVSLGTLIFISNTDCWTGMNEYYLFSVLIQE